VREILRDGAERANKVASSKLKAVKEVIGVSA